MFELTIIGNLGKDAELKTINGKEYIVFSVCHSERYIDSNGNTKEKADWVSCYKSMPSKLLPYLKKGTKVFVRGSFNIKVTHAQGKEYINVNCQVSTIQLLSSQKDNDTAQQQDETFPPPPEVDAPF